MHLSELRNCPGEDAANWHHEGRCLALALSFPSCLEVVKGVRAVKFNEGCIKALFFSFLLSQQWL